MATEASAPLKLFYCSAREDQHLRDELDTHLQGLRRSHLITSWSDGELIPGASWEQEIETQLETADIILLLVSPAFLQSDSCYGKEMQRAIELHQARQARVVPILLRPVDWTDTPFAHLHMLPTNTTPLTLWSNRDEAFVNVAKGIRRVVNDLRAQQVKRQQQQRQKVRSKPGQHVLQQTNTVKPLNEGILDVPLHPTHGASLEQQQGSHQQKLARQERPDVSKTMRDRTDLRQPENPPPISSRRARLGEMRPSFFTKHLSRRKILAGATAFLVAGGGMVWWIGTHALKSTDVSQGGTLPYTYGGHTDIVFTVAWSPDGKWIASASADKTVQVWNAVDGSQPYIYRGHANSVDAVAWSPDGKRIASASWDNTVQVWNAVDGSQPYIYRGHTGNVYAVAWSPDGKRITSASEDKTVQIWNAVDGSRLFTYRGHTDSVDEVAWSSDGKRIASASEDNTVQLWTS